MKKRVLYVLFAIITLSVLALCFTSCDMQNNTSAGGEQIQEDFPVFVDGKTCCKIIRSRDADSETADAVKEFRTSLEKICEESFDISSDVNADGESTDNGGYEILIGDVARAETEAVKAQNVFFYKDWCVKRSGKKLVVYASSNFGIKRALKFIVTDYENKTYIDKAKDYTIKADSDFYAKYPLHEMTIAGKPVSDYKIVYHNGVGSQYIEAISAVRDVIAENTGYYLEMCGDIKAETPAEILFGNTTRTTADDDAVIPLSYNVKEVGGKLSITYGGLYSLKSLTAGLFGSLPSDGVIPTGFSCAKDLLDTRNIERENGTVIRAVSQNLLAEYDSYNGNEREYPVEQRFEVLCATIGLYQPDFIGFQEASPLWQKCLMKRLPENYTPLAPDGNYFNYIAYRNDKYDLIKNGTFKYAISNNNNCSIINWGVFSPKTGGAPILFISTHLDGFDRPYDCNNDIAELSKLINDKKNEYEGLKVVVAGDFNNDFHLFTAPETRSCLCTLCENCALLDCKTVANIKPTVTGSIHGVGSTTIQSDRTYDHIFISDNYRCLRANITVDHLAGAIADHAWFAADIAE